MIEAVRVIQECKPQKMKVEMKTTWLADLFLLSFFGVYILERREQPRSSHAVSGEVGTLTQLPIEG
ncbi:MAG: hypothetical protein AAF585_19800, partial [Verrucomicrobiota bacterium]